MRRWVGEVEMSSARDQEQGQEQGQDQGQDQVRQEQGWAQTEEHDEEAGAEAQCVILEVDLKEERARCGVLERRLPPAHIATARPWSLDDEI